MKDLIKLYSIHSVSGTEGEKEMCDWLVTKLDELGVEYTRKGNSLYSISQSAEVYLSAHLDQVRTNGPAKHIYKTNEGHILAYNDKWQRTSLGADDKNGVWIILKLLEAGWYFDWSITESEEIGCVGIKSIEQEISKTYADFCIVLDRKGNTDILNKGSSCNYCQALAYNLKNFFSNGYEINTGTLSDAQTISQYLETVNMSVAYHNPHSAMEYTDFERLCVIKDDIECLFTETFVHYPTTPESYKYTYSSYKYPSYKSYWEDDANV